ncbi:hypothetical protein [Agrobacterium tumefaciens]|uniref:hypothetical protein n=1 Tax=Agrobacterium tumefaciens TaxID=358 RepID=UPI00157282B0|nr:hypothetical protein [Agrobacterium tumefaciens]NTD84359.1 hypothetical protein [Agrobacterium tumefaciens]NTD94675.1 hypothetical protein [Agrobacterium tumefaciens]NTD96126.1 hypothetical protein [Agrobacterium tumefaciens]NTE13985.1 hypothetical protein [Agrobacterium tumefaciens]NTE19599.1 hypothetical protein [Agrobacterium tumefaciens]
MNIFDFITQEEIEDLPDNDEEAAFLSFVRISRSRLVEATSKLDGRDEDQWETLVEARHGFMNVVTAAARRYNIKPFNSLDVPRIGQFSQDDHRQFIADLDHYMTQLLLSDGLRTKRDSVLLSEQAKQRIKTHLHHLREQIEKEDMPDKKRHDLFMKLDVFEQELNKRRLSLLAIAKITVEVLAVPGALSGSYDIATKLLSNVMVTVAQEKAQEESKPSLSSPAAILPARPSEAAPKTGGFAVDDDSDIPF